MLYHINKPVVCFIFGHSGIFLFWGDFREAMHEKRHASIPHFHLMDLLLWGGGRRRSNIPIRPLMMVSGNAAGSGNEEFPEKDDRYRKIGCREREKCHVQACYQAKEDPGRNIRGLIGRAVHVGGTVGGNRHYFDLGRLAAPGAPKSP